MSDLKWINFFKPGSRVVAVPNWIKPELLFSVDNISNSFTVVRQFFNVYTLRGELRKIGVSLLAMLKMLRPIPVPGRKWKLEAFLKNVNMDVADVVLIVGKQTPIQKVKIILLDDRGDVVGFLKYAERIIAKMRLTHEYKILSILPRDIAPRPIKLDTLYNGIGLLTSVISGQKIKAVLPPAPDVIKFMNRLVIEKNKSLDNHPWIQRLKTEKKFSYNEWLEPLCKLKWDVVIEHGDFVPWNLLETKDGSIKAVDWEFASLEGFPYIDIVYYILQIAALIKKWNPKRASLFAVNYLRQQFGFDLHVAASLVRLSAFEAYSITAQNGRDDRWPLQRWRRAIWDACE
ncbi:hypothetical protein DRP53_06545 [candidate division WOR-3 bacterium]|uniref:Aminoglycoside phosphotransferase domain-containing protein n=1 Tax=candidate division WOR-3 bacterium TaxID=2052148 RepID=A0A660SGN3_UNCW3|nr:MAG: hypothetical protein DRP53_06545 [candidate division WOR-3 bacterium]